MKRIPSLDGVRAVAISLVVMGHWAEVSCHSPLAGAFASLGRRVFFVLSGYHNAPDEGARKTLNHPATQILSSSCVSHFAGHIAFMMPVFVIFWHDVRWYHIAAAMLYLVNFDFTHPWFRGHLWSISVQEQFYFLWPSVLKTW